MAISSTRNSTFKQKCEIDSDTNSQFRFNGLDNCPSFKCMSQSQSIASLQVVVGFGVAGNIGFGNHLAMWRSVEVVSRPPPGWFSNDQEKIVGLTVSKSVFGHRFHTE